MAMAGPAANLVLVLLAAILMRVGFEWGLFAQPGHASFLEVIVASGDHDGVWAFCAKVLSLFFSLNLLLGAFNVLPLPPLDGVNVPLLFLPAQLAEKYWLALRQPILSWVGLIIGWQVFGKIYPPLFQLAAKLLYLTIPGR